MGSTPADIEATRVDTLTTSPEWVREQFSSEGPQHKVILEQPIYLGMHEVTQANYEKVMRTNPSYFSKTGTMKALVDKVEGLNTSRHPVEGVGWADAAEFCAKLSEQEKLSPFYSRDGDNVTELKGTGYRLPTEAEWEFACGAGSGTRFWNGVKDDDLLLVGWVRSNSGLRTHSVGELEPNPFGLFDLHGNVYEWLQDWWSPDYYSEFKDKPGTNPTGPTTAGSRRVVRGGWWGGSPTMSRTSSRHSDFPVGSYFAIGFRVSLPIDAVKVALAKRQASGIGK
jgi:formylglycine-generating enzyme required for sulfatase activity